MKIFLRSFFTGLALSLLVGCEESDAPAALVDAGAPDASEDAAVEGDAAVEEDAQVIDPDTAVEEDATVEEDTEVIEPDAAVEEDAAVEPSLLSVVGGEIVEGDEGLVEITFTLQLDRASSSAVTVDYTTVDDTATAEIDYISAQGTAALARGETQAEITVQVLGDLEVEPDEAFTLTLSNPVGAALDVEEARGVIINDDALAPPPALTLTPRPREIQVSWPAPEEIHEVTGFELEFHDGGETTAEWISLGVLEEPGFTHDGLSNGVTYTYRARALNPSGAGPYSDEVSATPREALPPPSPLWGALGGEQGASVIELSWLPVEGATGYRVSCEGAGLEPLEADVDDDRYASPPLPNERAVTCRVASLNARVAGAGSEPVRVFTHTEWTLHAPALGPNRVNALAHDDASAITIAVADLGWVARRVGEGPWTLHETGVEHDLTGVVWTGARFVAVGAHPTAGTSTILTSEDGARWAQRSEAPGEGLAAIAWSGARLLAVGRDIAIYSDDEGASWRASQGLSGPARPYTDVCWDGARFAVADIGSLLLLADLEGLSDLEVSEIGVGFASGIACGAGGYAAVGGVELAIYEGEGGWRVEALEGEASLLRVAYDAARDQYIAVGQAGRLLTHASEAGWIERGEGVTRDLSAIALVGGRAVAAGAGVALSSEDGAAWTPLDPDGGHRLLGLAWREGRGWWAADDEGGIYTSPEGAAWSREAIEGASWRGVASSDAAVVLVGADGLIFSDAGEGWTSRESGTVERLTDVIWGAGRFVATALDGGVLTSEDGVTWGRVDTPALEGLSRVIYAEALGRYVAIGSRGALVTSEDGLEWAAGEPAIGGNMRSLVYGGGRFIVGGPSGQHMHSEDGLAWEMLPESVGWGHSRSVTWTGEGFLLADDRGQLFRSADGLAWGAATARQIVRGRLFRGLTAGGRTTLVGEGGAVLSRPAP